jgi:hypothetical protein
MARFRKTMTKSLWRGGLVLAALLLLMNAGPARADIILNLVSVTPMGSDYQYTYSVELTASTVLHAAGGGNNTGFSPSNNFFTLYDIQGLVSGSETYGGALATNSMFTEQLLGVTPPTETPSPADSPSVLNVTTYWTGPDVSASGMPFDMGTFSFLSTNPMGSAMLAFTGATQQLANIDFVANNTGQVAGPGVSPVPEPSAMMLLALGLPVIGGLCYRRRN